MSNFYFNVTVRDNWRQIEVKQSEFIHVRTYVFPAGTIGEWSAHGIKSRASGKRDSGVF